MRNKITFFENFVEYKTSKKTFISIQKLRNIKKIKKLEIFYIFQLIIVVVVGLLKSCLTNARRYREHFLLWLKSPMRALKSSCLSLSLMKEIQKYKNLGIKNLQQHLARICLFRGLRQNFDFW